MAKDRRYNTIKALIESKKLKSFGEICDIVPITTIRKDIEMTYAQSRHRIDNPETFTIEESKRLAALIGVDYITVIRILSGEKY
jgi:hypothetical protein